MSVDTHLEPTISADAPGRRRVGQLLVAAAAVTLIAALFVIGGSSDDAEASEFHQIELTTLDGDPLDFADFEGTPVIVNFFASWCAACRVEIPALTTLQEEWGDRVIVVGLNPTDGIDGAQRFIDETGATFTAALDEGAVLLERFDGFGMPANIFVNGDGEVVDSWVGGLTEDAFREMVDEHFGVS